jgi:hypothetical protein
MSQEDRQEFYNKAEAEMSVLQGKFLSVLSSF